MSALTHAASGNNERLGAPAPLGALLVARGLLSEADLSQALEEQGEGARPLGAILVERGYVRPSVVAQALATQHGSILKTEYGFATGFDSWLAVGGTASETPASPRPLALGAPVRAGTVRAASPPPDAAEAAAAPPAALSGTEAVELELAEQVAENEKLRSRLGEMQLEAMRWRSESDTLRNETAVAGARAAGLEAAVATLYAERDQLRARVDELQARL
jgi:hypothetical protein